MKYLKACVGALIGLFIFTSAYADSERATADEAVTLVRRFAEYIRANGKESAINAVNNSKQFVSKDLYIVFLDANAKVLAHGANPRLVNVDLMNLKDSDGKFPVKDGFERLPGKNSIWIDYKWPNPITKKIENKSLYIEKFDDLYISAGVYRP